MLIIHMVKTCNGKKTLVKIFFRNVTYFSLKIRRDATTQEEMSTNERKTWAYIKLACRPDFAFLLPFFNVN